MIVSNDIRFLTGEALRKVFICMCFFFLVGKVFVNVDLSWTERLQYFKIIVPSRVFFLVGLKYIKCIIFVRTYNIHFREDRNRLAVMYSASPLYSGFDPTYAHFFVCAAPLLCV